VTTTTKEATSKPTVEDLEARAEEVASEFDELAAQLRDAKGQIARAQARFAELDSERTQLAPRTFQGDSKAQLALQALEDEYDELARTTRVARAAEPELQRMLEETKGRLQAARRAIHAAKASAISKEIEALGPERDRLADELIEVLKKQSLLLGEQGDEVRFYDGDRANGLELYRQRAGGDWLRKRFSRWLR